jgi:hypothetical protein
MLSKVLTLLVSGAAVAFTKGLKGGDIGSY